ncbi:hypothetical protein B0T24DRAFT_700717 [Lasiosphaeria ovina]|uniref:Nephrocystin 3-like N-terminal domain-containing protein n=1 Tax=Lasiosphaeria ovina TaxID=92902 RepID=A0AAE0KJ41_9PEZI|nr:hypothetical protein B0T24DRAFT_700717 [Lasiosphaeria ovina]
MSRQNQRHVDLQQMRADIACEFLLADTKFIQWYNSTDPQQLVIVGETGSGKSVAMSFLIDELRKRNKRRLPQPKVCYHYCQSDVGSQPIHVFCVLILSLLEQLPGLKRTFFEWYKRAMASGIEPATNFKKLEGWLRSTLETLGRPLIFAIDGLDECDRQSRGRLLTSLKAVSDKTSSLKILLSTRLEERILEQLNGMGKIQMECSAARDRLVVEKTVETRLSYLPGQVKALVMEALSRSARGSGIWTRMTVELIETRAIRALGPMRAFLDEMPQPRQLWELYASLYSRYTADDHVPTEVSLYCSWEAWEKDMVHYDPTERGFGELFVYASCYWTEHFGAVSAASLLPSVADIEVLCRAGSTRLHNWIAQNCRSDCATRPRFAFDSSLYDPLSITSLYGSEAMLQRVLDESDLDGPGDAFLPSPVMKAADQILQWSNNLERLRILWESKAGQQIHNCEFFWLVLGQWSKFPSEKHRVGWDGVFGLLDHVYDTMTEERWGSALLSKAVRVGCLPMVRGLFDAARHRIRLRTELLDISQSENSLIGAAVCGNHVDVMGYLLVQQGIEAHVQYHNVRGENVLHLASRYCNPAVFR